jgi:hypothetical protein
VLSTPVPLLLPLEIVELPGKDPTLLAGHLLSYRAGMDFLADLQPSLRCGYRCECRIRVQHDVRSPLRIRRHRDDPALIGATRLKLRVSHGFAMNALDIRKRGEPSVSLPHRSLDPLLRIEGRGMATDALAASLLLLDLEKSVFFQKGKPACDGLPQLRSETGGRSIPRESAIVLAHGLKGHEVQKGRRLRNSLEFVQTTVTGDLDENCSLVSRWCMDRTEGHDLPAHHLFPTPVLFDLRSLWHEVDAPVRALEDEKGPTSGLVLRSADHAPAELHTPYELGETQLCVGMHQKLAVPREAPP